MLMIGILSWYGVTCQETLDAMWGDEMCLGGGGSQSHYRL